MRFIKDLSSDKNKVLTDAVERKFTILCASREISDEFNKLYEESYHDTELKKIAISIDEIISEKRKKDKTIIFNKNGIGVYDAESVIIRLINNAYGKFLNINTLYFNKECDIEDIDDSTMSCEGCIHRYCYNNESCGYCNDCHNYSNHSFYDCNYE